MKDLAHVNSWSDLERYGINALTGECCDYGLRLLCDVNASGKELLCNFLGLPQDTVFPENWNSTVNNTKAVGSIRLPRSTLQELATYAMFSDGMDVVVCSPHGTVSGMSLETYRMLYASLGEVEYGYRTIRRPAYCTVSGNATHLFSGRTL